MQLEIAVGEFVFHYTINPGASLKQKFIQISSGPF